MCVRDVGLCCIVVVIVVYSAGLLFTVTVRCVRSENRLSIDGTTVSPGGWQGTETETPRKHNSEGTSEDFAGQHSGPFPFSIVGGSATNCWMDCSTAVCLVWCPKKQSHLLAVSRTVGVGGVN